MGAQKPWLPPDGACAFWKEAKSELREYETLPQGSHLVRRTIEVSSEFDVTFLVSNGLATVVACYGLFENSPAVVIGAMIIAMLLGPISRIGIGLVDKNNNLLWESILTLAGGIAVVRLLPRHRSDPISIPLDRRVVVLYRI